VNKMKTIIISIVLALSLLATAAQSEPFSSKKNIICDDASTLIGEIVREFGETPVWSGADPGTNTTYGVLMNPKTGTWTVIQFDGKVGCILGVGIDAKSLLQGSKNVGIVIKPSLSSH
jgi:hypothetical protein